ncbi:MAG: alpha/beta hydrolase [Proteobacteria bacterium]|nr:alpha/beta hydrolase [Pseudomonadota bacterium]
MSGGVTPGVEPMLLPQGDGQLFAVRHRTATPPRARVLLCPPLLQEQIRSYRFFAQLANQWARRGIEVVRFDYSGTGDSSGSGVEFSIDRAIEDIRRVWEALIAAEDGVPRVLCGVRMGALLAALAIRNGLDADIAWWWQPVLSGATWVEETSTIDTRERQSRSRFPLKPAPAAITGELMGHVIDPRLPAALKQLQWPDVSRPSMWLLDSEHALEPRMDTDDVVRLPLAFDTWAGQVDFETIIPVRLADTASERLIARLPGVAA